MKQVFIFLVLFFFTTSTLLNAQLRVGDPGVTFDQAAIAANSSCYPQMQRWSEAGVTGGIPFITDFDQTATIGPGNSSDINAAINAMSNSLSAGQKGLITLTNGNYTINSEVLMKSNVSLKGQSRNGVICNITINAFAGAFLFDNVSYAGIYDMTIQGSWGNPVYNWNYSISANDELEGNDCTSVWLINGANNCWLDRVNIFNSALHTLWCRGPQNTFRDLDVQGGMRKTGGTYGEGYFYIEGSDNLITGCYITHLRHITIQKHLESTWDVDYNVFYDNDFDQELSFHTRDDGNNLVENNRITLPYDMPPVAPGDADAVTPVEARTNKPIYFAIMGPWSSNTNHLVSANPNYILNNQCQQDNYNYGTSTPWSEPGKVYSGPIQKGLNDQQKAENFPLVNGSCQSPAGNSLYPVQLNVTPPSCETYGTDLIESCNPITWIDGNTYTASNNTATHTLTNVAGCDSIVTLNLTINNGATTTTSLAANADAYVRGSNYANNNYGSSDLITKLSGNDKYTRRSYIKFDLSAYNASDLVSATLELNVVGNSVSNTSQNLYHIQDDSWTENGITWNNQPGSASLVSSFPAPVAGQNVSIDITTDVITALGDNKIISLKIEATNNQFVTYASREQGASGPKLILTTGGGCDDEPCPDGDNDGICDADDNTNGNCMLNASCNDNDSCTINDQYDANCNCVGTPSGDSDNDGICDVNDNTNGNCTLNAACDDSDSCTTNDQYDANCNCVGTPANDSDNDGICDVNDNTNGNCTLNASCDDGDSCTINDQYDANCNCVGTPADDSDNDGICDINDNTNGNCTLNAACDDGDSCTTNDQYDANCNCVGTPANDSDNDGICDINDNTNGNCTLNASCDDGDSCTTNDQYDANCNCAGTPSGDADNDGICDINDNTNGNCTLNTACDDGDPCTSGETYDANCNCSGGAPVGNNSTEILMPTDDTYIRGSTYADDNYGNSTTMHIKKGGNDKWTRNGYLKFDLSTVGANQLLSATFRIKVSSNSSGSVAQELLKAPSDNWTESNLTWNNNQSGGSSISNFTAAAPGQWVEIDVTNAVQTEASGDGTISFAIVSDNNKYIRYHTKESSGNEPQLVLSYQSCNNRIGQIDKNEIKISPNPSWNYVTVELSKGLQDEVELISIYTTTGKLVSTKNTNLSERIFVGDLTPGLYIIQAEGLNKKWNSKFLKR